MPFFEDIDGMKVLERNSMRIEGLEIRQTKKLIKIFNIGLKDLRERIIDAPSNTFTQARMKTTIIQIEEALNVLKRSTRSQLQLSFDLFSDDGIENAAQEINALEKLFTGIASPISIDKVLESTKKQNFLFNQFESSVDAYSVDLRNRFQHILGQGILQKKTLSQVVADLHQESNLSEWRLARIARTELHQIYNVSKMNGFRTIKKDYFPDLKKTLYHPMDSRTGEDSKTLAKENPVVDLDAPFVFKYNGQERKFQTPPDRPNDRAILIPYRDTYDNDN